MLRWAMAAIVFVGLAAACATATPTQSRQVAQISDFFKNQEKLRRESQSSTHSRTAVQSNKKRKGTERPKPKRTRQSAKPREPATTGTSKKKKTEEDKKPPKETSQEARRSKPKPAAEEPKKPAKVEQAPSGQPAYIRAKRAPVVKLLGTDVAQQIFSHEFTPVRQLAISRSARVIPGYECPRDPAVALTDIIPFKVKPGIPSWIEGYVVGCKPRTKRSFLVMLEDGKPQFAELLPGLSIADPLLQRDAVAGAQASAKTERPDGCDKAVVSDTRLAEPLTRAGRPWVELWTVDQCGTRRRIEMRFTPSTDGGTRWAAKPLK